MSILIKRMLISNGIFEFNDERATLNQEEFKVYQREYVDVLLV